MLDLQTISAFAALRSVGEGQGVIARERKGLALATVMARKSQTTALAATVKEQFDIALPDGPYGTDGGALAFLGTGPGRWLAVHSAPPARFIESFMRQLEGAASVVDQSGAYGVMRLSGAAVLDTLAKGVAVDLACATGCVIVAQVAHIGVTLWKIDDAPTFDIAVARSLSGSFLHWLEASAAAQGLSVES